MSQQEGTEKQPGEVDEAEFPSWSGGTLPMLIPLCVLSGCHLVLGVPG